MLRPTALTIVLVSLAAVPAAQAQTGEPAQPSYQVGETIAPETFVYDRLGQKHRLLALARPDTKVIYLLLFGGASASPVETYGGIWCNDSFNDLPISNYLYLKYRERGVTFVAVACPPVYSEQDYGYPGDTFLARPESDPAWQQEFERFVQATCALQDNHVIPFDRIYFDPKFRLLFNRKKHAEGVAFSDSILPWMGKLKPASDRQSHSLPTIWLLSASGEILHEPFVGNRYGTVTQRIVFTVREVEAALEKILQH
ncbi:MAG: hypothetical protein ONB48_15410 [candidate division KSB1 bacterium]|nr:hypothetical protein [candidate division KSB1 bacterium]MDZ7276187.1 hypothetical protein [candidate division KSB1 bacterium]MDZ7287033.1 hypothetical protein [candidate division KSB1 bacterium]MDZ7297042.1 hypothetical protein [candidate division KSB1 bacterium]MDZ7307197.1 hypothetical protein [candidate division KSB1 bacterium]